jgi:formylglycine-generating enzyme
MRMRKLVCALSAAAGVGLGVAPTAHAVTMDWTFIGNSGNACDTQSQGCFGAVGYAYYVGTYEVTNSQYTEFLNAKAASDSLDLYNTNMGTSIYGGITRSGSSGSFTYSAIAGRGDMPVNFVSFYDTLRFTNWLNNGQGIGDTETGAYTLLGGTPTPINGTLVTRNPGANTFVTSEDEWYKAAYYDASSAGYFDYPAGSDTQTTCSTPTATANRANCGSVPNLTIKGSYTGSASPYGTFDQGGNVWEWNETIINAIFREVRGGSRAFNASNLAAASRSVDDPSGASPVNGFRVAMIPEPGTGLLVIAGLLGFAGWRRERA